MCIHPEIARPDAEVWVTCPQCSGDGGDDASGDCKVCEGLQRVPQSVAVEASDEGKTDERDLGVRFWQKREQADAEFNYPALSPADALLALRSRLQCAEAVQADFDRRGVAQRFPVALSIEEARALLPRDAA